jgi:hypothetical protein
LKRSFKKFLTQIFLADRNDHSPTFEEKSYVFLAPENLDVGHVIGAVQARDEDKGRNGEIQYRLRTTIKKFVIEASSGTCCLFLKPWFCSFS